MEYVNAALIVIGFFIIGYYQKQKIGALENQLNSQKEIIGNTKAFFDLFDLEKLKGYGDTVEKKVRTEMECQIGQIKSDFDKEHEKTNKAVKLLLDEFTKVLQPFARSLLLLSRSQRIIVIDGMQEGIVKEVLKILSKEIEEVELQARDAVFRGVLPVEPPQK